MTLLLLALVKKAEESGFDPQLYHFVRRGLDYTIKMTGKSAEEGEKRHVTGQELVQGVKALAKLECAGMAPWLLRFWGVRNSRDIGRAVFDLIELGQLSKREEDTIDDFNDGLDFTADFPEDEDLNVDWNLMPIFADGGTL